MRRLAIALLLASCAPPTGPTPTTRPYTGVYAVNTPVPTSEWRVVTPEPSIEAPPPLGEERAWYTPVPLPTGTPYLPSYFQAAKESGRDKRNGRLIVEVAGVRYWLRVAHRQDGAPDTALERMAP